MKPILFYGFLYAATGLAQTEGNFYFFGNEESNNRGSAAVPAVSGGVWFCGTEDVVDDNIVIYRIDEDGYTIWKEWYGGHDDEFVNNMKAYNESALVVCGDAIDMSGDMDGFLMMIDTAGNLLWRADYGVSYRNEDFYGVHVAANGDILVCGFVSSSVGEGNDFLVVRYSNSGEEIWRTSWGVENNDYAMGIVETPGGTIFVSGDRFVDGIGYQAILATLHASGDLIAETQVDWPYNSGCKTLSLHPNGKLLMVGETASEVTPVFDMLLVQADTNGVINWISLLGDLVGAEAGYDLAVCPDGSLLLAGFGYQEATENNDILVIHCDASGSEIDRWYYGGMLVDYAYDVQVEMDGSFWVSGFTHQDGFIQHALIHQQLDLTLPITPYLNLENPTSLFISPNPVSDRAMVEVGGHAEIYNLYNAKGQLLSTQWIEQDVFSLDEVKHLPPGQYFLEVPGIGVRLLVKQ